MDIMEDFTEMVQKTYLYPKFERWTQGREYRE